MPQQAPVAPVDISRLLKMAQSGVPIDFSSFSDEDFVSAMQGFSAFASRVFEGVNKELQDRNRGVMYCERCGQIELMQDPELRILAQWRPTFVYVVQYEHTCSMS